MKAGLFTGLWGQPRWLVTTIAISIVAIAVGAAGMYLANRNWPSPTSQTPGSPEQGGGTKVEYLGRHAEEETGATIVLPKEKWAVADLRVEPVRRDTLSPVAWVTGKIALNEDRLAHIYSLTDGQVHEVSVQFGDDVRQGQRLAVIDSKEVGAAKLELYKSQLDAEFARVNNEWAQKINTNTQELIETLARQPPLESISEIFTDKPMGEFRQQLVAAYARLYKSRKDLERLEPLASQGIAPGKQALAAKAAYAADLATFQALLEQLKFTSWQQALLAEQKYRQAEQAVATNRSRLYILGYKEGDLKDIDPVKEGESISHYEIRAPFDGTVIGKNVVLGERVGPDTEMFRVADLSTLWVQADIYQKDLSKLEKLGDELYFRETNSDHGHTAKIFYTGDVFDPETRTIRVRAVVDNPERRLKAGMFVEIALPGEPIPDVVVVPVSALQNIEGTDVVFVQVSEEEFQRRDVVVGARSDGMVQILEGLQVGDPVVVSGGFALKSELMKGLISEGD